MRIGVRQFCLHVLPIKALPPMSKPLRGFAVAELGR